MPKKRDPSPICAATCNLRLSARTSNIARHSPELDIVTEHMWRNTFLSERWTYFSGDNEMLSENVLETVATEKSASSIGEESLFRLAVSFTQPGSQDGGKLSTQRYAPFLPTFPLAVDVRAGSDRNVLALEPY